MGEGPFGLSGDARGLDAMKLVEGWLVVGGKKGVMGYGHVKIRDGWMLCVWCRVVPLVVSCRNFI